MKSPPKLKIDSKVWWRLPQQLRFLLAGAYNTAFGYVTFAALFLLLGNHVHYLVIGLIAQPIAVISAFLVHRCLVFQSREPWRSSLIRFSLSQLAAMLFGMAGLYSLVRFGHLPPLLAQAVIVAVSVVLTYLLHHHFSFRRSVDAGGV